MAQERLIRRRIKSVKNIAQITKAMQMVAASKMKKAQLAALSGRPYTEKIAEMARRFTAQIEKTSHPLLAKNENGTRLIVLLSTNKGLCGSLNTNLFRSLFHWFSQEELDHSSVFVSLGKKGETFLARSQKKLIADFSTTTEVSQKIAALTTLITQGYIKEEYKEVYLVYNNFLSALTQQPTKKCILPISGLTRREALRSSGQDQKNAKEEKLSFVVEPSIDSILDTLLFHYLENQIRDAVLEAEASEHSARMFAMKSASDNAKELITLLTLEYNKARQEKITSEIADIVTARLAVE